MYKVTKSEFVKKYNKFQSSTKGHLMCPADELPTEANYYLIEQYGGFFILPCGYFGGLFCTVRGHGDYLVKCAIQLGARCAEHFDGWLTKFYRNLGFEVYDRAVNWAYGQPDILFITYVGTVLADRIQKIDALGIQYKVLKSGRVILIDSGYVLERQKSGKILGYNL